MLAMGDLESSDQGIPRTQEQGLITAEVAEVQRHRRSRAVLLYGRGGIGKTRLVRQLPKTYRGQGVVWLDPIDVDDSQHWLLSNLELYVATQLDPGGQYFSRYHAFMSELPQRRLTPMSREMVIDHLNRIKAIFTECYRAYIDGTGNSVVITFDTVEAIRGMYLLSTLTRWMKELPGTLFILAGRGLPPDTDWKDPVRTALEEPTPGRTSLADPTPGMSVTAIPLREFNITNCRAYLAPIKKEGGLSDDDTEKLVYLTQGHPLWLAFTVDYISQYGLPAEMNAPLDEIRRDMPYHQNFTYAGEDRAEAFRRRLVAPYQNADFWHEAVKRLAVVRESVSQPIWQQLMAGRLQAAKLTDADQAWQQLRGIPWIRPRANKRYVTLHDAVAEELAKRVIGIEDSDQRWRRSLWRRATEIYAAQADELDGQLKDELPDVESRLKALIRAKREGTAGPQAAGTEAKLIREVAELDSRQQEVNQLRAAQLFYQLLFDFEAGSFLFVQLMSEARERHDVLFEDLLAFQMQRFLPGGADEKTLGDTVGAAITSFRLWLTHGGEDSYVRIGLAMAEYLIDGEQAGAAVGLLSQIPERTDHLSRYHLHNLQGNACLRIPGRVREAGRHFEQALAEADQLPGPDRYRYSADAHKELGYYYRNIGLWAAADRAYGLARVAISHMLSPGSPHSDSDRGEMASINTQWAYLKGIGGKYDDGINLVESAITVRHRLHRRREEAISYSVLGEVYRYQRQFKPAWDAYYEAEQLFGEANQSWLGVIYQEQAICLFQSIQAEVQLLDPGADPAEEAESLIQKSLRLCRTINVRNYPSALNRAGRIIGTKDPDRGLDLLLTAADKARDLSDGWFLLSSLTEYAELCYRASSDRNDPEYLDRISLIAERWRGPETTEIEFPELRGRWRVLQGHLAAEKAIKGDDASIDIALENYREGFPLITHGWVGSYGASAIPGDFKKFSSLAWKLPAEVRAHWRAELHRSWSEQESSTQLLARLEELY
jgi:tetratricopeptide (TPR) repeat protein